MSPRDGWEGDPLYEQVLAGRERVLGADPDTLASRFGLACVYESAGRLGEAIPLYEQALADYERLFGADHPDPWPRGSTWPAPMSRADGWRRPPASSSPWQLRASAGR